ncbi:unnamed protein product [Effrenium voratum]|uniref:Protein kinase domain-containing protein n=1 Tax=Effrenium voratum TaxID=2562239 RepID=A0AA36NKS7_9DINO|nr:unnamed protein product [Effrenium voratum]
MLGAFLDAAAVQELGSKLSSFGEPEVGKSWTEHLLRRFADQALEQEGKLQQAMSQRLATSIRGSSASTTSGGETTPEAPATPAPAPMAPTPSAHYVSRQGSDINYDPDIPEEYRDDLDPGYRIRECTEQELMLEIQDKYERALAAAPELLQWAANLMPKACPETAPDELLGAPKTEGADEPSGGMEAQVSQSSSIAAGEHTLADAIMHGVSAHSEAAEAPAVVPTFGAQAAQAAQAPPPEAQASGMPPYAYNAALDDAAPKALSCGKKERTGRPAPRYPESGDSFYPVELQGIVFDSFNLRIVHERDRTGFEETKDFPIRLNSIVAGRYQVLEYLGSAAFSRAVQCLDLETNRMVCMKIINNNKDFLDQSLDEIKLLRLIKSNCDNVDDKNCLALVDYFYHKEHLIIVTELLRDNLYEFSKYNRQGGEEPYFTLGRLQRISQQILVALEYIHQLYLIHADLKPENVLIKSYSRCEVKVIDFGSSCYVDDQLTNYVQSRSYRAPEVILGLPYDQKIDLWSLGCIIAELWSGFVLFQNDSVQSLLARILGILGPFPSHMMAVGRFVPQYFTQESWK